MYGRPPSSYGRLVGPYGLSYDPLEAPQAHYGAPPAEFGPPYIEPPYIGPSYMGPPYIGPPNLGQPQFRARQNPHKAPSESRIPTYVCRIHGHLGSRQGRHPYSPRHFGHPHSYFSLPTNFGRLRVEDPEYHAVMLKWYAQPKAKAAASAAATG